MIENKKTVFQKCCYLGVLLTMLIGISPSYSYAAFDGDITVEDLMKRNDRFIGDLDQMIKERIIRVLMPYSKTFFFFDGAEPKGLSYENVVLFEDFLNKTLKNKHLKVRLLVIPTSRNELLTKIKDGFGDIAIGNLTITDKRREVVDFSDPFITTVDEILVSQKNDNSVKTIFDLSGKKVHVRKSSSYFENLTNLNTVLRSAGKAPIEIILANDHLEDEDLLEMMNAGIVPYIIIDRHKGEFWAKIFENIETHPEIKIHSGGKIAWAVRKNSPQLKEMINRHVKKNKKGTLTGNVIINRYLKNTEYITNSIRGDEIKRFKKTIRMFEKYGKQYQFDHLMLAALAFQESRLDQRVRSQVGAVGVMQILPSTAGDNNVNIKNIEKIEPNIHAGTKYLRFMANRYFDESSGIDEFNRALFCFASYNAGPAKIARLRKEAEKMGLDPNVWFNNVEVVAAKRIGRETVQYVSNILKYYVSYKLLSDKLLPSEN